MNLYFSTVLGILGFTLGMDIPGICDKIISYKKRRNKSESVDLRFGGNIISMLFISVNGILWGLAGLGFESKLISILVSLIFTVAILIFVIDLQIRLIPNELVLIMFGLGAAFQITYFGWEALLPALICMLAVGLLFFLVGSFIGLNQVGAGDIKLAAVMGLILGYPYITIALIGMSMALLAFCLGGLLMKKLTIYSTFALAPFMMFGTVGALLYMIIKL